jgi:predicted RNase H-like nuclease (RuvC/YqgF family)
MTDEPKDDADGKEADKPKPKSKDTQRIKTLEEKIAHLEKKNQGHDEYRSTLEKELEGLKEKRKPAEAGKAAAQPANEVDSFVWGQE